LSALLLGKSAESLDLGIWDLVLLDRASVSLDFLIGHVWELDKWVNLLPNTLSKHLLEVNDSLESLGTQFLAGLTNSCHSVDLLTNFQHHLDVIVSVLQNLL